MGLDPASREQTDSPVNQYPVTVFMKGNREEPRCGFSATVVRILDALVPEYHTVDVLEDQTLRENIREYSSWPTIPQLYVRGEFVGGCDIIQEMAGAGELAEALGLQAPELAEPPKLTVTDAAARGLREASADMPEGSELHLGIDAKFQNKLYFAPVSDGTLDVESNGFTVHLDPFSASRANGVTIDAVDNPEGSAFRIDNPNGQTGAVQQMPGAELKRRIDASGAGELFDVRTPEERAKASIPGARLMTPEEADRIGSLPRDTPLTFHCHSGARSQAAAEHFAALGFSEVYNVEGGIDAWSTEIDPSMPRY